MKTKTFDCVEMKHLGAEKIRAEVGRMTNEEELVFWHERSQTLRQCQKAAGGQSNAPTNSDGLEGVRGGK